MFRTTKPARFCVYAFVNAAVVLLVLVGVFIGLNWRRMPGGFGEFLAIRVTLKNLFLTALFLLSWTMAFRAFGLSRPSRRGPLWRNGDSGDQGIRRGIRLCVALCVDHAYRGAFTHRIVLYFLPAAILACLCGRLVAASADGLRDL